MHKLYYAPGACSLAPHIMLIECKVPFELVKVNLKTKQTKAGEDFLTMNPKGSVPVLELAPQTYLTECAVILQYLAYQFPTRFALPDNGGQEHLKLLEWLNYVSTELHKGFTPLFAGPRYMKTPEGMEELKEATLLQLSRKLQFIEEHLSDRAYLMGEMPSIADLYLYNVCSWGKFVGVRLSDYPAIARMSEEMSAWPSVQTALKAEGLLS